MPNLVILVSLQNPLSAPHQGLATELPDLSRTHNVELRSVAIGTRVSQSNNPIEIALHYLSIDSVNTRCHERTAKLVLLKGSGCVSIKASDNVFDSWDGLKLMLGHQSGKRFSLG